MNSEKKLRIILTSILILLIVLGNVFIYKFLKGKPDVVHIKSAKVLFEPKNDTKAEAVLFEESQNVAIGKNVFKEEPKVYKIDINEASFEELMDLNGIGKALAERIISYREKTPFNKIEDIMNVSGIGTSKFEKIKDYIMVN